MWLGSGSLAAFCVKGDKDTKCDARALLSMRMFVRALWSLAKQSLAFDQTRFRAQYV